MVKQTTKVPLRFHRDGSFRVLMLTDLHGGVKHSPKLTAGIEALLQSEHPDLVLLGGDISVDTGYDGGICTPELLRAYLSDILEPLHRRGIPWAHVYGNHDREVGMTDAEMQAVYESFPLCLSSAGPEEISGCCNYVLPIFSSKIDCDRRVAYNIFALDSGQYYTRYIKQFGLPDDTNMRLEHPMCTGNDASMPLPDQVMWYYRTSMEMERDNGGKIPAIMYMHIPTPEHYHCAENPEQTNLIGVKRESVGCSELNTGLFAACLERGDVRGIFCGHDHLCTYQAEYCGVTLAYASSIGYDMSTHDELRGGRVIDLFEGGGMHTRYVRLLDIMGLDALRAPDFFEGGNKYDIRNR